MPTSIIDYIFRELAVSYLGRNDLAHVDPREIVGNTGLGSSDAATDEALDLDLPDSVSKVVSKGLIRGNLRVASGGRQQQIDTSVTQLRDEAASFPAVESDTAVFPMTEGATALKPEHRDALRAHHDLAHAGIGEGARGRPAGGGAHTRLRGRGLPRVRELHARAQRHLPQVRHLRRHERVQLREEQ